jgi:hypothetical protein
MKWEGNRESDNVEDRRAGGGGGPAGCLGGRSIGIGTIVVALLGGWVLWHQPAHLAGPAQRRVWRAASAGAAGCRRSARRGRPTWPSLSARCWPIPRMCGSRFSARVAAPTRSRAWCCFAAPRPPPAARAGGDGAVLLPGRPEGLHRPGFYETLKNRLGAPGDFAQAYVIAHEVGHHVQNLLGISRKMDEMRGGSARPSTTR